MSNNSAQKNLEIYKPEVDFDFDQLEASISMELDEQFRELEILEKNKENINNPEKLGTVIENVVYEQLLNQIGVEEGKQFIKNNNGLNLDLRDEAHIQTTENFAEGKIATHNTEIDYQERYDDWQNEFQRDDNGNIKTAYDNRSNSYKPVVKPDARKPFDDARPKGSKSVHKDHTVSAAELIRDPGVNAHMTKDEQIKFANGETNLQDLEAAANESKRDSSMSEWLNSERDGKRPAERFNIDEDELRKRDQKARKDLNKRKKEGEDRSIKAGKQSQKEEALKIGTSAVKAVMLGLLAAFLKNIIGKIVEWFREAKKNVSTLIEKIKEAVHKFVGDLKQHLINAADTLATTIFTAIIGPIVGTIKKVWIFIKQGWRSLKQGIDYLKDPANRNKPLDILMLELGKIFITGLTAGGAILLGEVIEKSLLAIPAFAVPIPVLGNLASIIGLFSGALVAGLIGAIALNFVDKVVAKKLSKENTKATIEKQNGIRQKQGELIGVKIEHLDHKKNKVGNEIKNRHEQAHEIIKGVVQEMFDQDKSNDSSQKKKKVSEHQQEFAKMQDELDNLLGGDTNG